MAKNHNWRRITIFLLNVIYGDAERTTHSIVRTKQVARFRVDEDGNIVRIVWTPDPAVAAEAAEVAQTSKAPTTPRKTRQKKVARYRCDAGIGK